MAWSFWSNNIIIIDNFGIWGEEFGNTFWELQIEWLLIFLWTMSNIIIDICKQLPYTSAFLRGNFLTKPKNLGKGSFSVAAALN